MVFQSSKKTIQQDGYLSAPSGSNVQPPEEVGVSVIGKGLTLKGEIHCHENLTVEGFIEGVITVERLLSVGKNGRIKADIKGHNVRIEGQVDGRIQADGKVEVLTGGIFNGELSSKRLVVQEGAMLHAEVKMEE